MGSDDAGSSADNLDLVNRDPQALNGYVAVAFDDILAEPEDIHSADCVWQTSYRCFDVGMSCWYQVLTLCCGLCTALFWGCAFAVVAFEAVWCITPTMRAINITLYPVRKVNSILLNTFLGPCISTLGMVFSRIHVVNSKGDPPKPLDQL